jgi:hypothetical protein
MMPKKNLKRRLRRLDPANLQIKGYIAIDFVGIYTNKLYTYCNHRLNSSYYFNKAAIQQV